MTTHENRDPLEAWLHGCPEIKAPEGFAQRTCERLQAAPPEHRSDPLRVSGVLCIASAFVLFALIHTPALNAIPQIIQALGGVLP